MSQWKFFQLEVMVVKTVSRCNCWWTHGEPRMPEPIAPGKQDNPPAQAHSSWHLRVRTIKPAGLYSHAPATMPCSRQLEGLGRTLDPRASEQGHWNCNIIQQIVALSSPSRRACALVHDPSPIFALASPSRRVLVCALHDPSSRSRIWKWTPS